MIVMAQKTMEITPKTSWRVGSTALCCTLKTVCRAYSGLVPMSPNTTPSAAKDRPRPRPCPLAGGSGRSGADCGATVGTSASVDIRGPSGERPGHRANWSRGIVDGLTVQGELTPVTHSRECPRRFVADDDLDTVVSAALARFPLAVRWSATAEDMADLSFAGQQDTFLNVQG